jgi:hypothetical protein
VINFLHRFSNNARRESLLVTVPGGRPYSRTLVGKVISAPGDNNNHGWYATRKYARFMPPGGMHEVCHQEVPLVLPIRRKKGRDEASKETLLTVKGEKTNNILGTLMGEVSLTLKASNYTLENMCRSDSPTIHYSGR